MSQCSGTQNIALTAVIHSSWTWKRVGSKCYHCNQHTRTINACQMTYHITPKWNHRKDTNLRGLQSRTSGAQKHGPIQVKLQLKCEKCKYAINTTTINEKLLIKFDIKYIHKNLKLTQNYCLGNAKSSKTFWLKEPIQHYVRASWYKIKYGVFLGCVHMIVCLM